MLGKSFKLLALKCQREYRAPSRRISQCLLWFRFHLKRILFKSVKKGALDVPLIVYDLRVSVISYDFLTTLFLHEVECRRLGADQFDLVIYSPESLSSFLNMGTAYSEIISNEKRAQRITNLLLPIAVRYKACRSVEVMGSAKILTASIQARQTVLPYGYDCVNFPALYQQSLYRSLASNPSYEGISSLRLDQERCNHWIKSNTQLPAYVTFTLRDYGHQPTRNLLLDEVRFTFEFLLQRRVQPVVIPDLDGNMDIPGSSDYIVCHDASHDFGFRLALYEGALSNVASPSGPLMAIVLSRKSKGVKINAFSEDLPGQPSGHGSIIYKKYFGISPGAQPLRHSSVHIIWSKDFRHDLLRYLSSASDAAVASYS